MIFWHWLILGAALILIELMAPGTYLLWIGLGALVTGGLVYLFPAMHWAYQAPIFAFLAIAWAVVGRQVYGRLQARGADAATPLNRRAQHLVGTIHTLTAPIKDGTGRIHVGDGTWRVTGPDLPEGGQVRVVAVDGITLAVEPVEGDATHGQS